MISPRLKSKRVPLTLGAGWVATLLGILNAEPVVAMAVGSDHAVCGAWGCGPPLSSLIVWHSFVAGVVIPAAVVLAFAKPRVAYATRWRVPAVTILLTALFLLINTGLWYAAAQPNARPFILHRLLFATVAFPDAPVLPLMASAGAWWLCGHRVLPANPHGRSNIQ